MRLIDADLLYKAMQDAEELARRRVRDTESTLPYPTNLNPAYTRYLAQMDERTKAKEMVADAPTVDAVTVVRCRDCKHGSLQSNETKRYHCLEHNAMMEPHYYCILGERPQYNGANHLHCPKCGCGWMRSYNFCPNCGAKMDGKGNGNETDRR